MKTIKKFKILNIETSKYEIGIYPFDEAMWWISDIETKETSPKFQLIEVTDEDNC